MPTPLRDAEYLKHPPKKSQELIRMKPKPLDETNAAEIKNLKNCLKFLIKYIKTSQWNRGIINIGDLSKLLRMLD